MSTLRSLLARVSGWSSHRLALFAAALVSLGSALVPSLASAQTGSTVDISPVKDTIMSNITSNLPTVLVVLGILMAIGVVFKLIKKARSA